MVLLRCTLIRCWTYKLVNRWNFKCVFSYKLLYLWNLLAYIVQISTSCRIIKVLSFRPIHFLCDKLILTPSGSKFLGGSNFPRREKDFKYGLNFVRWAILKVSSKTPHGVKAPSWRLYFNWGPRLQVGRNSLAGVSF